MSTAIVIPARYASSRLPGKVLLRATGKYLVQHVYEQAMRSRKASLVVIATDDSRVAAAVTSFGGKVAMTRSDHVSGTDRVAEVAATLDSDIIINLQGDEPLVDPASLDMLATLLEEDKGCVMATLATPLPSVDEWLSPHCVKVVTDAAGRALYFSRSPIPHVRDGKPDLKKPSPYFLQHLGIYAYRRGFLSELANLPPHPLEQLEKLEQLRVLASGHGIRVGLIKEAAVGVDTLYDYDRFVRLYRDRRRTLAA